MKLLSVFFLGFTAVAQADESHVGDIVGSAVPSVSNLVLSLIFGGITLGVFIWWRWLRPKLMTPIQRDLNIIAQCRMGNRQKLVVVQVGEKQLLLGVTAQSITCLSSLDKPIAPQTAESLWQDWLRHGES